MVHVNWLFNWLIQTSALNLSLFFTRISEYLEKYNPQHTLWKSLVFQVRVSCQVHLSCASPIAGSESGIFGIWDLTKIQCWIWKNARYLNKKGDFTVQPRQQDSPKFGHRVHDFFFCILGIQQIIHLSSKNYTNQSGAHQAVSPFKPNYRVCLVT